MHLETVYDYKTRAGQILLTSSNQHLTHRFSMCFTSTFIGANDSHIVLSMNSFGAIIILSSKAKLGWPPLKRLGWSNQVARIRFVYQPD